MDLFRYYVNQWYRNRLRLCDIMYCQIHLTRRCQNECKHCYFRELDVHNGDFPLGKLIEFLSTLKEKASELKLKPRVDFTGGDPLLYPDLIPAIEICNSLCIPYGFKCNPETIVTSDLITKNIIRNSSGVDLSLDGLRLMHDSLRREGSFDCTLRAIHLLKEMRVKIRINTTVSRRNINNLIPLINFLIKENIIIDDYTWARYWSEENYKEILTASELRIVFNDMLQYLQVLFSEPSFYIRLQDKRIVPKIMFGFKEHQWYPFLVHEGMINDDIQQQILQSPNCINCTGTKHFYIVDPDCSIYKCRKLRETRIQLAEFGTNETNALLKGIESKCKECVFYNGCGGCAAITKCFTGNMFDVEPSCPYKDQRM